MSYGRSVFINCPFDAEFTAFLNAIVFTIFDCGFIPRCALESANGHEYRFDKIKRLIRECKFGIHDISRTDLDLVNGLPRFNMPLELGVFIGAATFGKGQVRDKCLLILDRERFRYQKFMSDIAGLDIFSHENSTETLICCVRNWLSIESATKELPGGAHLARRFARFNADLPMICNLSHIRVEELTYVDFVDLVSLWARRNVLK
jgi:hypothetical protein